MRQADVREPSRYVGRWLTAAKHGVQEGTSAPHDSETEAPGNSAGLDGGPSQGPELGEQHSGLIPFPGHNRVAPTQDCGLGPSKASGGQASSYGISFKEWTYALFAEAFRVSSTSSTRAIVNKLEETLSARSHSAEPSRILDR